MRNFWVVASVDGRKTSVGFGPRAVDGQMSINIFQRQNGVSVSVVDITALPLRDGRLKLTVIGTVDREISRSISPTSFIVETER